MAELDLQRATQPPPTSAQPRSWPRWANRRTAELAVLVLVVGAAFLVRLWPIWKVHFWDETVYLQNAEVICCGKTNYSELDSRPPLLSLLFAGAFLLWHSPYAASVVTAALNALGPLFLYLGGRRVVGKSGAALAALLLAFSPFFVNTGNSILTDSPAVTLIIVAFWALMKVADDERPYLYLAAGLVSALAILMRFASLPTVALMALLLFRAVRPLRAIAQYAIGVTIGFGPYLLWSRVQHGGFLATLHYGWRNATQVAVGTPQPAYYYLRNFGRMFPWMAALGLGLWLVNYIRIKRTQSNNAESAECPAYAVIPERSNAGVVWFLWLWVLGELAYFSVIKYKEFRYIMPLAAPLFLLAGSGLATLLGGRTRRSRIVGGVALAAILVYSFSPVLKRFQSPFVAPYVSEEKQVSDFLNANSRSGGVLYANFNYPVFGYYTRLPVRVLLQTDDGFYGSFPENMPNDGYLILYKELDWNPRLEWADANQHFRRLREYPSLVVYEYRAW